MKKILFFSMLACAFVACGGGNVDKVKNATLRGYDTMTISAAIEGSKICASIKYEDVSKEGLNVVKITCKEYPEIDKKRHEKWVNDYKNSINQDIKSIKNSLKGEVSDDDLIMAAKKYTTIKKGHFPEVDIKGWEKFMQERGLAYKSNGDKFTLTYATSPLVSLANSFKREPKLVPVSYELNFVIKPDGSVEPKMVDKEVEIFMMYNEEPVEYVYYYDILEEFYKR